MTHAYYSVSRDPHVADTWTGLTVAQLAQVIRGPRAPSKISSSTSKSNRSNTNLSTLESYLSSCLLFHAAIAAVTSLDVALLPAHTTDSTSTEQLTAESNASRISEIVRTGVFLSNWHSSNLSALVSLVSQRTGVDVASWKLTIRLSPLSNQMPPGSNPADRWSPEALSLLEKFFDLRVSRKYVPTHIRNSFFHLSTNSVRMELIIRKRLAANGKLSALDGFESPIFMPKHHDCDRPITPSFDMVLSQTSSI